MLKLKSLAQDCAIALAIVLMTLLLMLALDSVLGMSQTPFLLFFGAVPLAALYCGRRGGILTTVLSAWLANYFFIAPLHSFSLNLVNSGRTAIFLLEGLLISTLIGALRLAQQQTKESLHQLKASEAKFRRLVDANIIGVAVCDIYGGISDANDCLLNSLGYTREDLLMGRLRWDQMTPKDLKHLDEVAYQELITKGKNTAYEKAFIGKQGQRIPVVVGAALLADHQDQLISFILDVSERKRAEQRLAVQYAVTRVLAEATTLADAIPLILQSLCESLGWQIGFFWQFDPQTQTLQYLNSWHTSGLEMTALVQVNQASVFTPGIGLPGRVWQKGEADWIANIIQDPSFPRKAIALEVGLHSVFAFPVSLDYEILGVIECFSTHYQKPDDDLLDLMRAIGSQIGQFIERKQTEEELRASQALFESFMNYSPANAFIKDESGRYIYVNPCSEQAFNRPLAQWLGKTDFELFPSETAQSIREHDLAILHSGQMTQFIESAPLEDGEHHYLCFKFPLSDAEGQPLLAGMGIDISDRKRFEVEREQLLQQVETSLGQLEAVINSMTEGLLITDAQGKIIRLNPAALVLHGYNSLEQVQQYLHEFPNIFVGYDMQGNQIPMEDWALTRVLRGETFSNWEIRVQRIDTGKSWIGSYSGTPVRNKQGQIVLGIITSHDVTDQKQTQAEIARSLASEKAARAEAEAANRIKDEFLAVLSHELRTPLNPILGWVTLLRKGNLDQQKMACGLETIERNTKLQIQLIDDLLDIARILQGKLTLNLIPANLAFVIEAAKETVRSMTEAKSIQIYTKLPSLRQTVLCDFNRLQQVVWNLLSNAVKFTPAGGQIEVNLVYDVNIARIIVKDTGKGIQPEFLPYVFDYFRQADSSTTRTFGGLGLGLAIARQIVELHGGSIQAESAGEGQGATFTVTLPVYMKQGVLPSPTTAPEALKTDVLPLTTIKVLVVDDELDHLVLVRFILEQAGATVITSTSAQMALQQAIQFKPDILISDIGMPEMDGYTLIRKLGELFKDQAIPAIALTAYAGASNQQQALAAGFQYHLSKPVDPDVLVKIIVSLLN